MSKQDSNRAINTVLMAALALAVIFFLIRSFGVGSAGQMVGQRAPDLEVQTWITEPGPDQQELAGAVVVVEFWATWCGPCMAAIPHMVDLAREYSEVVFIGLSIDESPEPVRQVVAEEGINYHVGMDEANVRHSFGVEFIPVAFVIDQDGYVAWQGDPGESEMTEAIEQLLALEGISDPLDESMAGISNE